MIRCKDCMHYEVCGKCSDGTMDRDQFVFESRCPRVEFDCPLFKPKSRFVELPCEVGQTVYFIGVLSQQIVPSKAMSILYNNGGFHILCENGLVVTVTEQLGKTVFLSREEAENALKERESK